MSFPTYKEPEWATKPSHEWTIIEIKSGIEITKYSLSNRPTTIFGRAVDQVHIPLHHESISRQHARIAFDQQGIPWLKDLQSTHGVKVNKRPLPAETISKQESNSNKPGSRGIMLFPGDIIQFGASTRYYTIDGPSEYERGAIQAKLQQQKLEKQLAVEKQQIEQQNQLTPKKKDINDIDEGASSWGISMWDGEEGGDDIENDGTAVKTLPIDAQIPEKYRKTYEKLQALKYKLSNLELEDSRIRRKGELTEGQEKQLQRNAEREDTLKKQIIHLETTLHDKVYPNDKSAKKKSKNDTTSIRDDDDDDDYFDRTKNQNSNNSSAADDIGKNEAESEESLIIKWTKIVEEQKSIRCKTLLQATDRVAAIQDKLERLQANGDDEAFFVQNDLELEKEQKEKITASLKEGDIALDEIEKLLKIVNPKLQHDRKSGYIGVGSPSLVPVDSFDGSFEKQTNRMPPPPPLFEQSKADSPAEKIVSITSNIDMLPPPAKPLNHTVTESSEFVMPPPKRKRVVGPTMPPSSDTQSQESKSSNNKQHPASTLSFLNATNKSDTSNDKSSLNTQDKNDKAKSPASKGVLDPRKDEWHAPTNQDGSGRTRLNDKFAGRY